MTDFNALILSFESLLKKSEDLKHHVLFDLNSPFVWINNSTNNGLNSDVNRFLFALFDIHSTPGLLPQQTSTYQGALGGTDKTIYYVEQLNKAKDKFRLLVKQLLEQLKLEDTSIIHERLYKAGYSGIKLKQAFRHIPYINYHPRQISFCQLRHNAKQKITKAQAIEKLKAVGKGQNIEVQLNKLKHCNKGHFIVHRETAAQWAANIATFKHLDIVL